MSALRTTWFFCSLLAASFASNASAIATPSAAAAGSVAGKIALDTGTNIGPGGLPPDATVRVSVRRGDDNTRTPLGHVALSNPTTAADGTRSIAYKITGLPLGVALQIAVEPVEPPGASPLPTGFAWLVHFRPSVGNGFDEVAQVTLTAASPAATVNFAAYGMEIPPLPQPLSTPSPAATASSK